MPTNNPAFSEKELMNDLIASEKQVTSAYNTGITETSCPNLRQELTKCLTETQEIQYQLFDAMKQRGWYQTKQAQQQDVQSAKTKYQQMKTELK
ncbi:spore coat protein [Serpentinicella alkaliphila]|uniref:Coat F domain-containing protein n=1 Tax=Serpentinicella alkaliphila TaxID=1734049 RepID=A0A4R2U080_9FIRM|nr:spore coat protein [Serpentinicella alkaliphila]QUH24859.1 spore coat protein [Serpentinicella alkaliphila]TCQ03429.1 coat F domain-containing protein [Serpentinicella alkaliphila]